MSKSNPVIFQWEAIDNPNKSEGVATFKCNGNSVTVELDDFVMASRLAYLMQAAYQLGKNDAIDRALFAIPNFLNDQRCD